MSHVPRKFSHYHIDFKPTKKRSKGLILLLIISVILFLSGGVYLFVLTQTPDIFLDSSEYAKTKEDLLTQRGQDFIKLKKLNLITPLSKQVDGNFQTDQVNWQYIDKGNPEDGGSFILCGSRFNLSSTPQKTKENSPFYYIGKLSKEDVIDAYYKGHWYSYKIAEIKDTTFDISTIKTSTAEDDSKLIMYSCSKNGNPDLPLIIIANPVVHEESMSKQVESGSSLL